MRASIRALLYFAGLVWLAVGASLAARGVGMLAATREQSGENWARVAIVLGLLLGALKGKYVLSMSARRNRDRIRKLSAPRPWNVFGPKFYPLIGLMIGFGALLRWSARAGYVNWAPVAGLYLGIGAALAVSALVYFLPIPSPLPTRREQATPKVHAKRGLLVVNLGTPDAPDTRSVKRYLKEFLSDRRVVDANRALWFVVLRCIILPFRSPGSAALYRKIWTPEGSPLLLNSQALTRALAARVSERFEVRLAMRYGSPSIASGLAELRAAGCTDLSVLSLFPQASNTTTGSIQAEVARLEGLRRDPMALRFLASTYDHPGYIAALAEGVRDSAGTEAVDFYAFSFHGLPEDYVKAGDPYLEQCTATAFALAEELGLARESWELIFQSRFGATPWLQPFADEFVTALAQEHKRVLICLPGFAADCLETLEEIGQTLAADFRAAGGRELVVVPALNDTPTYVEALAGQVLGSPSEPNPMQDCGAPGVE
ncbi:MAG: ferrochelatase [Planctomycetota bacterium]|jgi:ferrochelatase